MARAPRARANRLTGPARISLLAAALLALALFVPAASAAAPTCLGRSATIVALDGGKVTGTAHADVILTGAGADLVEGGGGSDRICTGAGKDRVLGGVGSDRIALGPGDDSAEGGNGSDEVRAGGGTDTVLGNRGNDRLFGDAGPRDLVEGGLGDDTLAGGDGDLDQLIGDIGNDDLFGGRGDGDLLRGDRGADLIDGGPGVGDEASYAVSGRNGNVVGGRGVAVNLAAGVGDADGDDRLRAVENVIGTPFQDQIVGAGTGSGLYGGGGDDRIQAGGPADLAFGGPGSDTCTGFSATDSCGAEPTNTSARIEVDVAGGAAANSLTAVYRPPDLTWPPTFTVEVPVAVQLQVAFEAGAWVLRSTPLPIVAGDKCALVTPGEARCPSAGRPDAAYLGGGKAGDRLEVDPAVPAGVSVLLRGEYGHDTLVGGPGDDDLDGSPGESSGPADLLYGRGGDDALTYGALLSGGGGSDLLIATVCDGARVEGGGGIDSVSFARVQGGIEAKLGGTAGFAPVVFENRTFPGGCGTYSSPTRLGGTIERIEGSRGDDILIGNGDANILLGREGEDELRGGGGDDLLVGGNKRDSFYGEGGFDRLYANDGSPDPVVDCGRGEGVAKLDPADRAPRSCRVK